MSRVYNRAIEVRAARKGLHEITDKVQAVVAQSGVEEGLCNIFIQHTSASLVINENADPTARRDLEEFLCRLVPENMPWYRHTAEGPDDMPSHIKSILTNVSITVPVIDRSLGLGSWQGIYLWEHRDHASSRKVLVSVL
jgi:secondary thiamine-phosphate synthase enzyme